MIASKLRDKCSTRLINNHVTICVNISRSLFIKIWPTLRQSIFLSKFQTKQLNSYCCLICIHIIWSIHRWWNCLAISEHIIFIILRISYVLYSIPKCCSVAAMKFAYMDITFRDTVFLKRGPFNKKRQPFLRKEFLK